MWNLRCWNKCRQLQTCLALQREKLIAICVKDVTYAMKHVYCNACNEQIYLSLNDVHESLINSFSVNCCRNTTKKLRNHANNFEFISLMSKFHLVGSSIYWIECVYIAAPAIMRCWCKRFSYFIISNIYFIIVHHVLSVPYSSSQQHMLTYMVI